MESSRTITVVMSYLNADMLTLQDKLERVINSDSDLENKSNEIRMLLRELVMAEQALIKFQNLIEANNRAYNKE